MVRLLELIARFGGACELAGEGPAIDDVHLDSRRVEPGCLFAALPGSLADGADFVPAALERGARAVLSPAPLGPSRLGVPSWVHPSARRVAGEAAALVHGQPARHLFTAGITGTNGKTTTAHLAHRLLEHSGRRPALLGTAGNRLADGELLPAANTTPDAPELQRLLARHRRMGGDSAVLEVSSHALDQDRCAGTSLSVAVFTNLSRDHLDYHRDMESYAAAKERLFATLPPDATAVIHGDDPAAERMAAAATRAGARVLTYSARSRADLRASDIEATLEESCFNVSGMGIGDTRARLPLPGRFNVENALAAIAVALLSGASPSRVLEGLASASSAPGRLEEVPAGGRGFRVLVDYAHTEEALKRVLSELRELAGPDARIVCLFGCGGDRDRGKREPMGRAAGRLADVVVLTSDNPRGEDPAAILEEVSRGIRGEGAELLVEADRGRAIRAAISAAGPGDVVLIAGKGHETRQWVGERAIPFDDRLEAAEALS